MARKKKSIKEIKMNNFNQINKDDGYLKFIMFYGKTCGPCKATMPHYEEAVDFYLKCEAKVNFFKFHAWEDDETKSWTKEQLDPPVKGVPGFQAYFNGELIKKTSGGGDYNKIHKMIHDMITEVHNKFQIKI